MAATACMQNCTHGGQDFLQGIIAENTWTPWDAAAEYFDYSPWLFSLLGSSMIGLTGIFPLLIIPIDEGADLKTGDSASTLRILLSFAVGGLLGDVFLHLLPEAWESYSLRNAPDAGHPSMTCGLWVLTGFLVFIIVEKMFSFDNESETVDSSAWTKEPETDKNTNRRQVEKEMENNNCITLTSGNPKNGCTKNYADTELSKAIMESFLEEKPLKNGYSYLPNGYKDSQKNGFVNNGIKPVLICNDYSNASLGSLSIDEAKKYLKKLTKANVELPSNGCIGDKQNLVAKSIVDEDKAPAKQKSKRITGYLNLMANVIDNFTHGLAVGGSFLISFRLGALTTFAILVHEIPHEVGDFAILLRSGFNRWDAARAQIMTATGGIFGAMTAVLFSGGVVGAKTSWILPFTAGGFLHIGLVTILPELLKESNPRESLKQLGALILGITLMAVLTILCD